MCLRELELGLCDIYPANHTFMNIWLRLYIVDKAEDESPVLNIFGCHTFKFPGGRPLQSSFLGVSFLFNISNQIHQQGEKCKGRRQQRIRVKEL